ncbi:MAG TPA: hypothetical protein VMU57_08970 [Edaphobacter sp.]|uniref:hypothetical protein n=1 Tax=Edaphobacter sp. TaxID=1934404 RepID=UPI002BEC0E28|nr:hypothetical protein [Edaphobacter sp.]HUZ95031.1 hypothetical protein [Edaphobacter sp.]
MQIVTAHRLKQWAETLPLDAQADLPELVRSLIRASCPDLEYYRFPGGNASQTHGWDGVTELKKGVLFVPEGRTIWEFGAGADYKNKANGDYTKRTEELTVKERNRFSFIFVTPRIWDTGLEEWIQQHSGDGWQSVHIYDANALEHWLADQPAVAVPLGKKLGILPLAGFQTVQDFWDEHSLNTQHPLKEELLLAGRADRAKRLCEGLSAGLGGLSKWQADSATEAALFIAAAMRKADDELSRFLLSKTLFVESFECARQMPPSGGFNLILLPEVHRLGAALARTNQVVLALGADGRASEVESLDQMTTLDFAAGLRAMGIDEHEAFRLAGICCRSVVVLSRLDARGTVAEPAWSKSAELVPLILCGGWDASNENDRTVVAELCQKTYDEIDLDARSFAAIPDAPLDLEGSVWTVRSPKDAFTLMGSMIGDAHQQRLRDASLAVFSEVDQTLDVPDEEQPIIPTRGADFGHSEWLRRGLSTTLLLISGLHEAARFRTIGGTPEQFVEGVVGGLRDLAVDIRVLASLKSEFPKLIEAAPFPLASAIERVLGGDSENWVPVIFRGKEGSPLFGQTSPHTYILWALETLAWNPEYLFKAASILLTLAQFDPGGTTQNRPINSLRTIFLAWLPQTYASVAERIAVVRRICLARPEVGFKLALELLPSVHDVSHGTSRPRLRDFGDAAKTPTTRGDAASAFKAYADLAIELADRHPQRLAAFVDHLAELTPQSRERAIRSIRSAGAAASAEDKYELWTKLRLFTQRHRGFRNAAWALPEDDLHPLEALCQEIAPDDPLLRDLWQFNDLVPKLESRTDGDYVEEANKSRRDVIRRILDDRGIPAVVALAKAAKEPHLVGYALAEAAPAQETLEAAFGIEFIANSGVDEDFFVAASGAAHFRFGAAWDRWIADLATHLDARRATNLFLRWPDTKDTWDFVQTLGPSIEEEYWKRKYALNQSSDEDLLFAIEKYDSVGRFSASVELVAYQEKRIPTEVCVGVLRGLVGEINATKLNSQHTLYSVLHLLQALQGRKDISIEDLASIEYQYLPLLEHLGEPVALGQLLKSSPKFFIEVICDVFFPASEKERKDISVERRVKARFGYQMLQSMKSLPGFTEDGQDVNFLRNWIAEARDLAKKEDREVITDQQIGQMLAYAPTDAKDSTWPARPVRDVIEECASDEIERGISISRFNMRGVFRKAMYEGGGEERAFAAQYRTWAGASASWPRTCGMLRRIAEDWERRAEQADTRAELDQRRDS